MNSNNRRIEMKITELHNGRDFVVSDCTREQAQCQKPNSNDYGIITLYNDRNAKDPEKRETPPRVWGRP